MHAKPPIWPFLYLRRRLRRGRPYNSRQMNPVRPVTVVMVNRPVTGVASRWASHQWMIGDVFEDLGEADAAPHDPNADETLETRTYRGLNVELHKSEGEGYWLNLNTPTPCLFVMWRQEDGDPPVPWVVTASYNEAGRMLDAGEKVENVPISPEMNAWVAAFAAAHYTPEVRKKVKRNDPFHAGAFKRGGTPQ